MIRCCGQLDKEEARGWLVNDAIGRPLLHRNDERGQNSAREVGKRVAHAATAAESAIKAAKAAIGHSNAENQCDSSKIREIDVGAQRRLAQKARSAAAQTPAVAAAVVGRGRRKRTGHRPP